MAKLLVSIRCARLVLLTPECELWQSYPFLLEEVLPVLLTPECELWQSYMFLQLQAVPVLLTPECELWQSAG